MKSIADAIKFIEGVVTPQNKIKAISRYYREVYNFSRHHWGWEENGPQVRFARQVIDIFTGDKLPCIKAELIYKKIEYLYNNRKISTVSSVNTPGASPSCDAAASCESQIAENNTPIEEEYIISGILLALELILFCFCDASAAFERGDSINHIFKDVLILCTNLSKDIKKIIKPHIVKRQLAMQSNMLTLFCLFSSCVIAREPECPAVLAHAKINIFDAYRVGYGGSENLVKEYSEKIWDLFLQCLQKLSPVERGADDHCSSACVGSAHYAITPAAFKVFMHKFHMLSLSGECISSIVLLNIPIKYYLQEAIYITNASSYDECVSSFISINTFVEFEDKFKRLSDCAKKRLLCSIGRGVTHAPVVIQSNLVKLLEFCDAGMLMLAIARDDVAMLEFLGEQIEKLSTISTCSSGGSSTQGDRFQSYQDERIKDLKKIIGLERDEVPFHVLHLVCIVGATKILQYFKQIYTVNVLESMFCIEEHITDKKYTPLAMTSFSSAFLVLDGSGLRCNLHSQHLGDFYKSLNNILQGSYVETCSLQAIIGSIVVAVTSGNIRYIEYMLSHPGRIIGDTSKYIIDYLLREPDSILNVGGWSNEGLQPYKSHNDPHGLWRFLVMHSISRASGFPRLFKSYYDLVIKNAHFVVLEAELLVDFMRQIFLCKPNIPAYEGNPIPWLIPSSKSSESCGILKTNLKYMCNIIKKYIIDMEREEGTLDKARQAKDYLKEFFNNTLQGVYPDLVISAENSYIHDYICTIFALAECLSDLLLDLGMDEDIRVGAISFMKYLGKNHEIWSLSIIKGFNYDLLREVLIKVAILLRFAMCAMVVARPPECYHGGVCFDFERQIHSLIFNSCNEHDGNIMYQRNISLLLRALAKAHFLYDSNKRESVKNLYFFIPRRHVSICADKSAGIRCSILRVENMIGCVSSDAKNEEPGNDSFPAVNKHRKGQIACFTSLNSSCWIHLLHLLSTYETLSLASTVFTSGVSPRVSMLSGGGESLSHGCTGGASFT